MKNTLIDYQELKDYEILYKMFGDIEYKKKHEFLLCQILDSIYTTLRITGKYLIIQSIPNENNKTNYCTVIKAEENAKQTLYKVTNLLESLGIVEWIKCSKDHLEIQIKDGYTLIMYDFTNGVI
ncbi:hypothetical protein [Bacillus infantis]|uniref:hypothetical protein n=1 Tax=Bacillus infantis TaxID=324767 RepID=UPI003CF42063